MLDLLNQPYEDLTQDQIELFKKNRFIKLKNVFSSILIDYFNETISKVVNENNIENIQESLDSMKPRERVKYIIDLIKLVLPTLRLVEHINPISENPPSIDFRKLFNFKEPEN